MRLSKEERETIIRKSDADDCWDIYASSQKEMKKFDKVAELIEVLSDNEGIYAKLYKLSFNQISFRKPYRLSDEEKNKRANRLNHQNRFQAYKSP